jgi:hypothetical protein
LVEVDVDAGKKSVEVDVCVVTTRITVEGASPTVD